MNFQANYLSMLETYPGLGYRPYWIDNSATKYFYFCHKNISGQLLWNHRRNKPLNLAVSLISQKKDSQHIDNKSEHLIPSSWIMSITRKQWHNEISTRYRPESIPLSMQESDTGVHQDGLSRITLTLLLHWAKNSSGAVTAEFDPLVVAKKLTWKYSNWNLFL